MSTFGDDWICFSNWLRKNILIQSCGLLPSAKTIHWKSYIPDVFIYCNRRECFNNRVKFLEEYILPRGKGIEIFCDWQSHKNKNPLTRKTFLKQQTSIMCLEQSGPQLIQGKIKGNIMMLLCFMVKSKLQVNQSLKTPEIEKILLFSCFQHKYLSNFF